MYITCSKIGCNKLVESPNKYCKEHKFSKKKNKKEYNKKYDKEKRNKERKKFYNSRAWKIVREKALARDNYLCQRCLKDSKLSKADVVHHIKPIETHWKLRLVLDNLESLCHDCHNSNHNSKKNSKSNKKILTRGVL